MRTGEIDQTALDIARRRFRADLAQQRLVVALPIYESHFQRARHLLIQYGVSEGLRTLDSLQLAIALDLQQSGHIGVLVSADQRLCRVAPLAGCPALNPDKPGPVLALRWFKRLHVAHPTLREINLKERVTQRRDLVRRLEILS